MNKVKQVEESDEYEEFLTDIVASERKQQLLDNLESFGEYLQFKTTTTYIPGSIGKSIEDIGFSSHAYIPFSDLVMDDSDPWKVFPHINIADHI